MLKILAKLGLKGHLPKYIQNFLTDCRIRVRIGDALSQPYVLENGLPQGSVLSCLLFSLVINSIFEGIEDIFKSLFCDDGLFWAVDYSLEVAVARVQRALDCIAEWCDFNGPKLSPSKTHYVVFTKRKVPYDPVLSFRGTNLTRKRSVRYLGVIFDQGLTWGPHIDDVVSRCKHPLQILQYVSKSNYGGDRASLRMVFIALVRSKMEYACMLFSNAAPTHLLKLDRVQYAGIRLLSGNYLSTVTDNLEAEAHLMPLAFRRELLALRYFGRVRRVPRHPV